MVRATVWLIVLSAAGMLGAGGIASVPAAPTFAADIAPIVYANCTACHRPGRAGSFPLISYEDVRARGRTIVDVTTKRSMPPWRAVRANGFPEFRDERRVSDADLASLTRWVDAGMPSGNLAKAPVPPVFPSGWPLGIPDLVVRLPQPIFVPADGLEFCRNVPIAIDLPDDRWIAAIDFEPSARTLVPHALVFLRPADGTIGADDALPGLERGAPDHVWEGFGAWVRGMPPRRFPEGIAQSFPKHSSMVIQLCLHPSRQEEREEGQVAIYFTKTPPTRSLAGIQVPPMFGFAAGIDIPAGEPHYTITDSFVLPVTVEAYGARGHAHDLARDMRMTARLPGGATRGLLWIKDWDVAWQDSYFYKAPLHLPKGTTIDVQITYDNSTGNPHHPSSPLRSVRWGRESSDEMGSITLLVAAPPGPDAETLRQSQAQHLRQQLVRRLIKR